MRQGIIVDTSGPVRLFGIRVRPGASYNIFGISQCELTDRVLALEDIWGRGCGAALEQHVLDARNDLDRVTAIEQTLLRCLRVDSLADAVTTALSAILSGGGSVTLGWLASEVGSSDRNLERLFREYVGLSPKTFCRIVRFQRALRSLEEAGEGWAAIAADCGYYDQSHLIRDFREFARQTPSAYLRHAAEISRYAGRSRARFVGFLQDFSGRADYLGFATCRRLVWRPVRMLNEKGDSNGH
jgi:AraC-like DNA-binding protein